MKTTVELPEDLIRIIKIRAVEENRKLKDMISELLRRGLQHHPGHAPVPARRVSVPLVRCAHEASPDEELTPERVASLLLAGDVDDLVG